MDLVVVTETEDRWETAMALRKIVRESLRGWPLDLLVYAPDRWEDLRRLPGLIAREADEYGVRLYDE